MKEDLPSNNSQPTNSRERVLNERIAWLAHNESAEFTEQVFQDIELLLQDAGFSLAEGTAVAEILSRNDLFCRSESFTKITQLLESSTPINITNPNSHANMCIMASGQGFKTAMQEGFSGKDVGGVVKAVITFSNENIKTLVMENNAFLQQTKPQTALVSLAGRGEIHKESVKMVSLRFPVRVFPEKLLTEEQRDLLEDNKINFIVRHYVPVNKMTAH